MIWKTSKLSWKWLKRIELPARRFATVQRDYGKGDASNEKETRKNLSSQIENY
jgi:hypothetical protein